MGRTIRPAAAFTLIIAGCTAPPAPPPVIEPAPAALPQVVEQVVDPPASPPPLPAALAFGDLPGWSGERHAEALPALLAACGMIRGMAPDRPLGGAGPLAIRAGNLMPACTEAARLRPGRHAAARAFFERRFRPLLVGDDTLTGYFEPELRGSLSPVPPFTVPLHRRPPELAMDVPAARPVRSALPDRAAIAAGALAGRGLELLWVDSPVDAFFLHIQGSGRVRLPDGRVLRVGYDGQNGHPYVAVGRVLVERGVMPREVVTMQSIRAWMAAAGPAEAAALMARNPSYVFFRLLPELPPASGPVGALGVSLTPMRNVAVDRAHVALGLPVWLNGRDPITGGPLRRLAVAADVGGAIRGPARADLFTGWGVEAAERAGRMRERAEVYALVPR